MLRYENLGTAISVDLHNGYSVIAMAKQVEKYKDKYEITLYLKDNKIDILDLINDKIEIESDHTRIKRDVGQYITLLLTEGFFKHYIDRYEYSSRCFEFGNKTIEDMRMIKNV